MGEDARFNKLSSIILDCFIANTYPDNLGVKCRDNIDWDEIVTIICSSLPSVKDLNRET